MGGPVNEVATVNFLSKVEAFSAFKADELEELAKYCQSEFYEFGATLISSGDHGKGLYIVKSGRVRLFTEDHGKEKSIGIREDGDTFGELSILQDQPFDYSVRSSSKTEILIVSRQSILAILHRNKSARSFLTRYIALKVSGGFLTQLFDLRNKVTRQDREEIIQSIGIKRFKKGQKVIEQDSAKDRRLYVVREGEVNIVREENRTEYILMVLGPGEVFGEKACLDYSTQPSSAIAATDGVTIVIPQNTVHLIIKHNPNLKKIFTERIDFADRELLRYRKLAERRERRFKIDFQSKSKPGRKLIKNFPFIEQAEEADCGAACLAMICKHYNIPMTLGKLRDLANVTAEGATMDSLARVGDSLGFVTKGIRCTYKSMMGFELPFIVHWEGYHYIVVYGISKNHIWAADPAVGFRKMMVSEFEQGWTGNTLLFTPTTDLIQISVKQSPWLRFINYLVPHKKVLRDLFFAALILQLFGLAPPIIMQNILDRVIVHQNTALLNLMIIGMVIITVFSQLTDLLSAYLSNFMIRKMDFSMMSHFYKHVLSLPIVFFARRKTGDIIARFQENDTIREFMTETSVGTILNTMMIFVYFIAMFIYNVKLTLLLIAFLPPIILLTVLVTPKYKKYARQVFYADAAAESMLVETIGGAETVKGMGIERSMRLKWERNYAKALDLRYRQELFTSLVEGGSELLKAASTIVLLWIGSKMVLSQQLSIGQLMAFNALIGSAMGPILGLVRVWDELHEALVSMERLGDVLEIEPEQKPADTPSRVLLPDFKGNIKIENVYFRYGGPETNYVLENINLNIEAGTTVALVGYSGSGKSTLAKLLVGFYKQTEGRITIDGYDMNMLDLEYYRSQIGYVMQSNLLFSGTISENIAIGDSNPDPRRVAEVAKLADAHAFISNMPLGYEQFVGERGSGLSGGQIQRICIARALYYDPRFLILDEATSALDTESENHIQMNMRKILKDRTAVIIAHRLSTIMNANRILVLYDGAIVEEGTHQELLDRQGVYFHLVQRQISGSGDN
jgi:ATP-binding cassette subfamily B protein